MPELAEPPRNWVSRVNRYLFLSTLLNQTNMSSTTFGTLFGIFIVAVLLASLAGTPLQGAINYFFEIAALVFGGVIAIAITIKIVFS